MIGWTSIMATCLSGNNEEMNEPKYLPKSRQSRMYIWKKILMDKILKAITRFKTYFQHKIIVQTKEEEL